ncbi:MAG: halocarboxylic acid dehydrogenase DehI family protein [Halomonas sp.]|nr:halocarboxylic acid dehydrogenase DehI family protein [Halomonas sp.]
MNESDQQRLAAGEALLPSLADITPDKADARVRDTYESIQATLRVPFNNYFFRSLANWPDYFDNAWRALAPGVGTYAFERIADELRVAAVPDSLPAIDIDWSTLGPLEDIRSFTDSIHYVLPKLVLIATCLDLGLVPVPRDSAPLPHAVAPDTQALAMVSEQEAPANVKAIFEDIKVTHSHPGVASYYRGIAHWPEFLSTVWQRVKVRVGSEDYQARKEEVLSLARQAVEQRLDAQPLETVTGLAQPDEVGSIAAVFRYRFTIDLLLDVGLIQGMLGGRQAAMRSRFSVHH